jgi:hypothetical protein
MRIGLHFVFCKWQQPQPQFRRRHLVFGNTFAVAAPRALLQFAATPFLVSLEISLIESSTSPVQGTARLQLSVMASAVLDVPTMFLKVTSLI